MKLIINARDPITDQQVYEHIEHRIGFAFARIRESIRSITLTLCDINGPKGGIDKQCKIMIKADSLPTIVIVERQAETIHAIDRCISRAGKNLIQHIKRKNIIRDRRAHHQVLPMLPEYS